MWQALDSPTIHAEDLISCNKKTRDKYSANVTSHLIEAEGIFHIVPTKLDLSVAKAKDRD